MFLHSHDIDGSHFIEFYYDGCMPTPYSEGKPAWREARKLNVTFSSNWKLGQIIRTEQESIVCISLHSKKPLVTLVLMWDLINNIEVTNYETVGGNYACFYSVDASKNYSISHNGALVNLYEGLKLDFWQAEIPDPS